MKKIKMEKVTVDDEEIYLILTDKELIELIKNLHELKESRSHIHFRIGNYNFMIQHEEDDLLK